jgi:hypothetical protein
MNDNTVSNNSSNSNNNADIDRQDVVNMDEKEDEDYWSSQLVSSTSTDESPEERRAQLFLSQSPTVSSSPASEKKHQPPAVDYTTFLYWREPVADLQMVDIDLEEPTAPSLLDGEEEDAIGEIAAVTSASTTADNTQQEPKENTVTSSTTSSASLSGLENPETSSLDAIVTAVAEAASVFVQAGDKEAVSEEVPPEKPASEVQESKSPSEKGELGNRETLKYKLFCPANA